MTRAPYDPNKYDPEKRRERYLRDRELKGRKPGSKSSAGVYRAGGPKTNNIGRGAAPAGKKPPPKPPNPAEARARVSRLTAKVATLQGSLTEAMAALAESRRSAAKTAKENSDGKSTAAEKKASQEYRDKNEQKIKEKDKAEAKKESSSSSSSGSSSSSSSSPTSVSDMSESELQSRVNRIRGLLATAKKQLSDAKKAAGSVAHSDSRASVLMHRALNDRKESVLMTDADFGGWATRHDVQCADGRTILPSAFKHQDGVTVPLVYQHGHTSNEDVLGHARLEYRPEGVYAHAYFNQTPKGQAAKEQVQHGDLKYLSIFANGLSEKVKDLATQAKDVLHGSIREVSLVLAGANPEAFIDHIAFGHSEDGDDQLIAAVLGFGIEVDVNNGLSHAADEDRNLQDILDTLNPEQETAVNFLLSQALTHADGDGEQVGGDDPQVEAAKAAEAKATEAVATAADNSADEDGTEGAGDEGDKNDADAVGDGGDTDTDKNAGDDVQHDNLQEDNSMSHNIFDGQTGGATGARPAASLAHGNVSHQAAFEQIIENAKEGNGSLKHAFRSYVRENGMTVSGQLAHAIGNIDYLFPDAQVLENSPQFVARRMEWVTKVLGGVNKRPFSRLKTITADITADEARARGYIKGNFKEEEYFSLSKRTTDPQTIYKKQRLDRDDVVDITTIDVVAWLKAEMRLMLDEELAGAILIGDGRSAGHADKIKAEHIRPIATDAELYATKAYVNLDTEDGVEALVDSVIENRQYYKGSGTPTFFTSESVVSAFLTVKDNFGRRLYSDLAAVAAVLRVTEVVPVEIFERDQSLIGIMVNLSDYALGMDAGGQVTMFDDFNIDYNKMIYLIETRCSGALTTPKAAIVFRRVAASAQKVVPVEPTREGNEITVPTVTGVVYKNAATNATLTTASPTLLAEGEELTVVAEPEAGYYFGNSEDDQWTYEYVGA
jgi:phage head maturation protease